jgi:hypothetical protein
MDVKLSRRKGKKARGIRRIAAMIFHATTSRPGISASKLSAKRTMRATFAPISSSVNRRDTTIRADCPNET